MDFSSITINPSLPIAAYENEIIQKFETSSNMIIIGETGSGKTTQIPLMLMKSLSKKQDLIKGKIAVTQPRRVAATSVAGYVAQLLGEELGQNVGYKIRFCEITSPESKLIFMTDGIMLREAQLDPLLLEYSAVMVDEAHERNINSDFLIGLLVDIQRKRKEQGVIPLKILATSATLEKDKFEDFFTHIEDESLGIIEVPGRLFPITSNFEKNNVYEFERRAAEKVLEICAKEDHQGYQKRVESVSEIIQNNDELVQKKYRDILIFMPGKREIEKTKQAIETLNEHEHYPIEVITIHANLPIEEQNRIFKESDKRKVVIATNIAETSLTVPGIVHVIDSGLIKQMEYNPHTGINSLVTHLHSRKGLEQRKGRAGRVEPGYYHALFTEESLRQRSEFTMPEILRTSLSQVVLIMKRIGIEDIEGFHFIDKPNGQFLHNAMTELQRMNALDTRQCITPKGITMAHLPLEPRLSNLVIEAQKNHCVESICTICAFLELKPVIINYTLEDFQKKIEEGEILIDANQKLETNQIYETYDLAGKLFRKYQNTVKKLEYEGSDFFTIQKIWNQWIKYHMQEAWATENYLSVETLTEATNIREELLDIVKKSGYIPEDRPGKDLQKRIEKTLINAFKYNMLFKQKSGFYKKLLSNESGIRLHNTSVLMDTKPYYAVAFEVIEINEIDAQPKLSARFLHTVEETYVRQLFPRAVKSSFKRERDVRSKRRGREWKKFRRR